MGSGCCKESAVDEPQATSNSTPNKHHQSQTRAGQTPSVDVKPSSSGVCAASQLPCNIFDTGAIDAIFAKYATEWGEGEQAICGEGFARFFEDAGVSTTMSELSSWALCYALDLQEIGILRKDALRAFGVRSNVHSMDDIRANVHNATSQIQQDPVIFKKLFLFCFKLLLERPEHRSLHCRTAIPVLEVLVSHLALGPSLVAFMKERRPETERLSSITRDEWAQMLPFLLKYHTEQLSQYSDGDAWPVILDEFVEWCTSDKHNSKPGES